VLDTALDIAAEHGIANVTMGALAKRMGVTRPVVYACYAGRGEVLGALLDRETELTLTGLRALLPPRRTDSVEQMFVDGFQTLLTNVRERPASWQIMFATDADPVLIAAIGRGRAQIKNRVEAVMRPLLQRRQVADIERALPALTEVFLAIGEAAVGMMLNDPERWTPESLSEIVGRAAYRALRANG
jgi:AcrR family transcriptional regulator